jgi:hypothetical protein
MQLSSENEYGLCTDKGFKTLIVYVDIESNSVIT